MISTIKRAAKKKIVLAKSPIKLNEIISAVYYSHIARDKTKNIVSLFLCHVPQTSKHIDLRVLQDAMRVDVNTKKGEIQAWFLKYKPRAPDLIIRNILQL